MRVKRRIRHWRESGNPCLRLTGCAEAGRDCSARADRRCEIIASAGGARTVSAPLPSPARAGAPVCHPRTSGAPARLTIDATASSLSPRENGAPVPRIQRTREVAHAEREHSGRSGFSLAREERRARCARANVRPGRRLDTSRPKSPMRTGGAARSLCNGQSRLSRRSADEAATRPAIGATPIDRMSGALVPQVPLSEAETGNRVINQLDERRARDII